MSSLSFPSDVKGEKQDKLRAKISDSSKWYYQGKHRNVQTVIQYIAVRKTSRKANLSPMSPSFCNRIYSKRKEYGSKFFPFKVNPFLQEGNQEVTKLSPLLKPQKIYNFLSSFKIS